MSSILLFRLLGPDRAQWRRETPSPSSPETLKPSQEGTLEELAAAAAGQRPVLVVPGREVTLTRARLPGRNRATWAKVVPYALEEQLAEDVEDLHFALGRGSGEPAVAVLSRESLEEWLATCAAAGVSPVAVVPEPLLLPWEEERWSVLVSSDQALVRTGPEAGFGCEPANLPLLLELALTEAGDTPPAGLTVWGELPDGEFPPTLEVHHHPAPPDALALLGDYRPGQTLDLLQGPYSRRAQVGKWLRPWRAAAVLAGLWLVLGLAFQVVELIQLSRERDRLDGQITQIFRQTLPDARVVNPRVQMEQRLRELARGGNTDLGFLELLYRSGQTLTAFEGISLKGLRFKDDRLDLDLEGSSLETFDRLKQRLGEQPGVETQMRTSRRDDRIQSQVTLRVAS